MMMSTIPESTPAVPLIAKRRFQPLLVVREVVLGHAETGHREAGEHADGIERYQLVDLRTRDDEQEDRHRGQDDDPGGEDEPVTTLHELAR